MDISNTYVLERQIGFVMRRAVQRHIAIFSALIPEMTPTQFAALAKLCELDQASQNELGRLTSMDVATIKGVVDRLIARGLLRTAPDPDDRRRHLVSLTPAGVELIDEAVEAAIRVSAETLAPLREREKETLLKLLKKIGGE